MSVLVKVICWGRTLKRKEVKGARQGIKTKQGCGFRSEGLQTEPMGCAQEQIHHGVGLIIGKRAGLWNPVPAVVCGQLGLGSQSVL